MLLSLTPVVISLVAIAPAQDDRFESLESRLQALEVDNAQLKTELSAAMDGLAAAELGVGTASGAASSETMEDWSRLAQRNLGPRAANVYTADGLSFGGYGEFLGEVFHDREGDRFDALRWVLYFGNRFNDRWIFNSEIEVEHGSTSTSSATTDSGGSVSVEFAYIDHLVSDDVALRGGVVLVPLGFINERHEPTTFLPSARPQTETRIIPSTWRASGLGGYGQVGPFAWTAYVLNGLNGQNFDASGLRGGRQKGNRASIDDVAIAAKIDYVATPGLIAGVAAFQGDSGINGPEDLSTTIFDAHVEWNEGPWLLRGLYASADVDDTAAFNTRTGENLAERLDGWYLEAGFDLLSLTDAAPTQTLDLFIRYEELDTQASLAGGLTPSGGVDDTFTTIGLNYRPIDQVVLKLDYTALNDGDDVSRFLIGYAF